MAHKYRHDIDGLRAVAVAAIVLFHAKFATFLAGGFVGVDIFFVISGYLITRAIQDELAVGDFSLIRFYGKRIRRICPALLVMLFVCTGFAAIALSPQELKSYGRDLTSSALFISNFLFARQSDYFAPASEQIPLLHTWSLSVEEQFYLLWPLTLMVAWRFGRSLLVILAVAAGSLAISIAFLPTTPTKVFYLLQFRAWQLAIGALLATAAVRSIWTRMPRAGCEVASAAGLAMIATVALFNASPTVLPGVLPCLGAALIIAAGEHRTPLGNRILQLRPVVFIGLISYSLYLWHWPVLTFGRNLLEVDAAGRLGLVVLATGLAFLSWSYVEKPARAIALTTRDGRRLMGGALAAVAALAGIGTALRVSEWRIEPAVILAQQEARRFQKSSCLARGTSLPNDCLLGAPSEAPGAYQAILWGDSHAAQFAPAVHEIGRRHGVTIRQVTGAGCPPLPGVTFLPVHEMRLGCSAFNEAVIRLLAGEKQVGLVLIAARWDAIVSGGLLVTRDGMAPSAAQSLETAAASLRRTIDNLSGDGRRVIIVGQVPIPERDPVACDQSRRGSACLLLPFERTVASENQVSAFLEAAIGQNPRVWIVSPRHQLCRESLCPLLDGKGFIYMDASHLSSYGAGLAGRAIEQAIADFPLS